MNENNAKIHLKIGDIEFTIEGSPDYVARQYKAMEKQLHLRDRLTGETDTSQKPASRKRPRTTTTKKKKSLQTTTQDFSQWLENLPKDLKNRDKLLVAGYFNQLRSKNHTFRVRDLNNTLKNQGIKISNPSSLINNLLKTQNVLRQVSREGRQKYYQLTKEGEKYIRDLLGAKNK
ncbi:MAG: hypothetical protein ACOCTM_03460 [Bacteroidota bacterium]